MIDRIMSIDFTTYKNYAETGAPPKGRGTINFERGIRRYEGGD